MFLGTIFSRVTFALASYKAVLNTDVTGLTLNKSFYNIKFKFDSNPTPNKFKFNSAPILIRF